MTTESLAANVKVGGIYMRVGHEQSDYNFTHGPWPSRSFGLQSLLRKNRRSSIRPLENRHDRETGEYLRQSLSRGFGIIVPVRINSAKENAQLNSDLENRWCDVCI